MDKMLDSDSTQASSLFHSQDLVADVAYFPAFHIVLLSSSERIFFEDFRFLELFFTEVVALGFPFSRASPAF